MPGLDPLGIVASKWPAEARTLGKDPRAGSDGGLSVENSVMGCYATVIADTLRPPESPPKSLPHPSLVDEADK
jgi:hypothetical protein